MVHAVSSAVKLKEVWKRVRLLIEQSDQVPNPLSVLFQLSIM